MGTTPRFAHRMVLRVIVTPPARSVSFMTLVTLLKSKGRNKKNHVGLSVRMGNPGGRRLEQKVMKIMKSGNRKHFVSVG